MLQAYLGRENPQFTGPIHDGICVRQEFTAEASKLVSVELYFATYKRKNPGKLNIEVFDFRRRKIAGAHINTENLEDNSFREFGMGASLVVGQRYELKIWSENCRSGLSATSTWGVKTKTGHLFVGRNLVRDGELTCNFNYEGEAKQLEVKKDSAVVAQGERPAIPASAVPGMVSVVIPNFKCADYLAACLSSIAKQTYSFLDVIVVDDGSPDVDKVDAIVSSFKSMLPAINLIKRETNGGAPAARNDGAALAMGEYLFFCDADVELYPESIETLVRCLLEVPGASFAYGGFKWGHARVEPKPFDKVKLRQGNYITTMSLLRAAAFPGWDVRLKRHQDWDLWLTMVDNGHEGVCCNKYLFETPIRQGSISTEENIPMMDSKAIVVKKHGLDK